MSKLSMTAGFVFIAANFLASPAQTLPVANPATATTEFYSVQNVAWVCDPYRCWWQPNYYNNYARVEPREAYPPFPRWRSWYGSGYDFNTGYPAGSSVRRRWW